MGNDNNTNTKKSLRFCIFPTRLYRRPAPLAQIRSIARIAPTLVTRRTCGCRFGITSSTGCKSLSNSIINVIMIIILHLMQTNHDPPHEQTRLLEKAKSAAGCPSSTWAWRASSSRMRWQRKQSLSSLAGRARPRAGRVWRGSAAHGDIHRRAGGGGGSQCHHQHQQYHHQHQHNNQNSTTDIRHSSQRSLSYNHNNNHTYSVVGARRRFAQMRNLHRHGVSPTNSSRVVSHGGADDRGPHPLPHCSNHPRRQKGVPILVAAINLYEGGAPKYPFWVGTCAPDQRLGEAAVGHGAQCSTFCGRQRAAPTTCRCDITGPAVVKAARLLQYAIQHGLSVHH
jgi:hypothetical protein